MIRNKNRGLNLTISLRIAQAMVIGSVTCAALIYLVFANSLSEDEMVALAYVWVPLAVAGSAVWLSGRNTLIFAVSWFLSALAALLIFFNAIFPQL